ncbi:hypothetical protein ACFC96_40990 [Streptomyces sp. NPDC055955]|uniref:hypothetical protein n=1 Tax=Streptomyces sp. NPDC055955 TaxID=3345665 RepID=UPI0035DD2DF9
MPRHQSRAARRARRAQEATGRSRKYTALLRAAAAPPFIRKDPVHADSARRLADHLRAVEGDAAQKAARFVDDALAWALKDRELLWVLWETPDSAPEARRRAGDVLKAHRVDEIAVHDAPLVKVVHLVLEMAADEAAPPQLLRAAADVLNRLVGYDNYIFNSAIYGVRAAGWLSAPRMGEPVYTTTDPVATLAAGALRSLRDAARIPDEDDLTDAECLFTLQEAVRFALSAADLAAPEAA